MSRNQKIAIGAGIVAAGVVVLAILVLRPGYAGTPIIIRGGSPLQPNLTIEFVTGIPDPNDPKHPIEGEVESIKVLGASKCMIYQFRSYALVDVVFITDPADDKISVEDKPFDELTTAFDNNRFGPPVNGRYVSRNPSRFTGLSITTEIFSPSPKCTRDGINSIPCYEEFPNGDWPAAELVGMEVTVNPISPSCN